jgi:glucose uptake protein GlcU
VTDTQIVLLVLPILIIEIGLILFALRDLLRPERRVRGDRKLVWGLVILFVSLLGPILYLTVGRLEE